MLAATTSRACVHIALIRSRSRDQQDRLCVVPGVYAHSIGSAETIEKWVNRSNVLPALRLNGEPLSLLSAHNTTLPLEF